MARTMKAAIFVEPNRIALDEKPVPDVGPLDALVRVTTTTICGTDVHILKGEYPVARRLTIGHEPVGVIEKLGSSVGGYREGQRVIAGAITPSGHSVACLCGCHSQDGAGTRHGFKPLGGWRFGNTIDGAQAEYLLVPDAMANLAPIPDGLSDEQVLMCPAHQLEPPPKNDPLEPKPDRDTVVVLMLGGRDGVEDTAPPTGFDVCRLPPSRKLPGYSRDR